MYECMNKNFNSQLHINIMMFLVEGFVSCDDSQDSSHMCPCMYVKNGRREEKNGGVRGEKKKL